MCSISTGLGTKEVEIFIVRPGIQKGKKKKLEKTDWKERKIGFLKLNSHFRVRIGYLLQFLISTWSKQRDKHVNRLMREKLHIHNRARSDKLTITLWPKQRKFTSWNIEEGMRRVSKRSFETEWKEK